MRKFLLLLTAILALSFTNNIAYAQEEKTLPGDTSLPSSTEELLKIANLDNASYDYSIEDYFEKPKQSDFQFSPDGKFLSYREKDGTGKKPVFVKDTETNEVRKVISEGDELIRGYGWASDNRLIFIKDQGGNENYQLFAVDIDGSNLKSLTPFENVKVNILASLKEQPDYMIISMNKDNPQTFEPYKINIVTGDLKKLFNNKNTTNPIAGYEFDKDGNLRGYTQQQDGKFYVLFYRTSEDFPFEEIMRTNWKDSFGIHTFDYSTDYEHDAYISSNLNSDTEELLLYDLKEKKVIKKIFKNETYDAGGVSLSRKRGFEIDYYSYTGEKYHIVPVSETYKNIFKKFKLKFGDKQVYITSKTDEENKYLLYVTSDKLYGNYFIYDAGKDSFKKLLDLMPQLKESDMAEMRPIKFKSRDGLTIHGYVTIPKIVNNNKSENVKIPLIVNPHGGPYGPRDRWGFNPETQLFASRGYATLQVNYRGSGGYGKDFFLKGNKQIGRKMLDDLEDAVSYMKKEFKWIAEDKIAIYGASYGGLATLGSLVKTPDLYTCGVDYVGVSNLFTFFKAIPPYWKPYLEQMYEQWYNIENEEERDIMVAVSPALNVEKITKPLFVIQGANDPRVNIDEADQMVSNIRKRGFEVPYMVKYNEGHGFGHEENRIELYKTMLGFFYKHLK